MAARTLLQQAVPTTFGAVGARWLVLFATARDALEALSFPVQLGGAGGTLAGFGDRAFEVVAQFAAELALVEPLIPWHTDRTPITAIASALEQTAAAVGKVGLDVVLLSQTEIAEVREAQAAARRRCRTSTTQRAPFSRVPARAGFVRKHRCFGTASTSCSAQPALGRLNGTQ